MSQNIDLGGNTLIVDGLKVGATGPGQAGTELTGAEIILLDGITAGTVTASKAVVVDSSKNIATFGTVGSAAHTITSASATALAVGLAGATTPAFTIDASTASQAAGLKVTGAATGGTVAVVATDSGSNTNLTVNAKGSGTIGIGSVSTGAVTITPATTVTGTLAATNAATVGTTLGVTGVITPTGGVAAAGGFTARPSNWHTGGVAPATSGGGTDVTPSVSETYYAAVFVPCNSTITGARVFLGSATEGNVKVGLADSAGAVVATSATTDASGATVDAYLQVAFTGTYAAKGPATYYVLLLNDNTGNRFNAHAFGAFPAGKTTGETYATGFTTIASPATTFTADLGPMATLY